MRKIMRKMIRRIVPVHVMRDHDKYYIKHLLDYINDFCCENEVDFDDVFLTVESDFPDENDEHLVINGEK